MYVYIIVHWHSCWCDRWTELEKSATGEVGEGDGGVLKVYHDSTVILFESAPWSFNKGQYLHRNKNKQRHTYHTRAENDGVAMIYHTNLVEINLNLDISTATTTLIHNNKIRHKNQSWNDWFAISPPIVCMKVVDINQSISQSISIFYRGCVVLLFTIHIYVDMYHVARTALEISQEE